MSEAQFKEWANRRSKFPLSVKGHTFVMQGDNVIIIDGGKFVYEEAMDVVRLLNSRSPFSQVNATMMILERNGMLRLVVLGLVALIIIVALFLALR
jgi:hypothetical protein